jgi:hypothetical protein|tara:strand:- start:981 stop:2168 length:1188 start_codon:yes stop_codon:yes gene_type:complete
MGDILKEAIADAKAVRATALANAKMALEEAFTPQLKSMLSAKLREDEFGDEDEAEEEIPAVEGDYGMGEDEFGGEEEVPAEEPEVEEGDYGMGEDEFGGEDEASEEEAEFAAEGVIEINGVQYAPVVSEEDGMDMGGEDEMDIEDDGNLDLEAIIRELETEINEEDEAYAETTDSTDASHLAEEDDAYEEDVEGKEDSKHVGGTIGEGEDEEEVEIDESLFTEEDDDDEDEEAVEENNDVSSGIGGGDNKNPATNANKASTEDPGDSTEVKALGEELGEYKAAVRFLKDKLHEVNILNAKLLFTNKLFKEFTLDNNQKLKVVETFDRTQSTREIKLIYSTLCEQFSDNSSINKKNPIRESASSKSGSTKPSKGSRKVITEENVVANRFKKLAGLL